MKEKRTKEHSTNKRNTVAVVALLLVCVLAIGGTIAYLTSHSQLTNTFTVGQISPIDPNKPGPGPDKPIDPEDPELEQKLNGNLYEPSWNPGSKLLPTASIDKDPYVGVGAGSEECDVFVYVNNTMNHGDNIYFTINEGWRPVGGTKPFKGQKYTGGLFKYEAGLNGTTATEGNNVWTNTPLFSTVEVSKDAKAENFKVVGKDEIGTIMVQSFLHQSFDSNGKEISNADILAAAKEQFGLNK